MEDDNLQNLFLKDIAYQFMLKQFETDPQTRDFIDLFKKHGMSKEQSFAILVDLIDMNEDDEEEDMQVDELQAAINKVFNKVAQVERKLDRLNYKLDSIND